MKCLTKVIFIVTLLCSLLISSRSYSQHDQLIISQYKWTTGVNKDREPINGPPFTTTPNHLYLWLLVNGNQEALNQLRVQGMLPIRCRWFHYVGTHIFPEQEKDFVTEISLGVGLDNLISRLQTEINLRENRYFDWRTWSMSEQISVGGWEVEVVYSDPENTPVLCQDSGDGSIKPCKIQISFE